MSPHAALFMISLTTNRSALGFMLTLKESGRQAPYRMALCPPLKEAGPFMVALKGTGPN